METRANISPETVTIIIPAFNEAPAIGEVIDKIRGVSRDYNIIVVDDGSADNTGAIAEAKGVKMIRHPYNKGYGAALKTGLRATATPYVIFVDADMQHEPSEIPKLTGLLGEYDLVIGARTKTYQSSFLRKLVTKMFTGIASRLTGFKIEDLTSGFRAFKTELILKYLNFLPNSFSSSTTSTIIFIKEGYNVKYVPVQFNQRAKGTKSTISPVRDTLRFFGLIFRIVILYEPMKVSLPLSALLTFGGLGYFISELIMYSEVGETSVLLILTGLIIFIFGVFMDQLSTIMRGR